MHLNKYKNKYKNFTKLPFFLKIQILLEKIPLSPVKIYRFFILGLDAIPQKTYIRGVRTIRLATSEDIPGLCLLENKPHIFTNRICSGEYCVVAIDKEVIVGYEWFSTNESYLEERFNYKINIQPDTIYTYDAFIKKEYRLRGIWVQFKVFIKEFMDTINRKKIITLIDYGNDHSLKTHIRFGFKLLYDVFVINIFRKTFFLKRKTLLQEHNKNFILSK